MNTAKIIATALLAAMVPSCGKKEEMDHSGGPPPGIPGAAENAKRELNSKNRELQEKTKEALEALKSTRDAKR